MVTINRLSDIFVNCLLGEDATEEFQNIGHSDDAKKLMIEYYIGDICEEAMPWQYVSSAAYMT